jgi:hypothetical protein
MSAIFPARLLPKTHIAAVSRALYAIESRPQVLQAKPSLLTFMKSKPLSKLGDLQGDTRKMPDTLHFSVAAWLRLLKPLEGRLSLIMVYRDDRGEFAALLEEINATDQDTLMMSGEVEFPVSGTVHQIDIYLGGHANVAVSVEQLYVKKLHAELQANRA